MSQDAHQTANTPPPFAMRLPSILTPDGVPSDDELDSSELTNAYVETKTSPFRGVQQGSTQHITASSLDMPSPPPQTREEVQAGEDTSSVPPPPQRSPHGRGLWVCQMCMGRRMPACTTPVYAAVPHPLEEKEEEEGMQRPSSPPPPPEVSHSHKSASASDSDDTISSHEGSFYASLRMEQRGRYNNEAKSSSSRRHRRSCQGCRSSTEGGVAAAASPTSTHTELSAQTSIGSFQAEIINFGFTPSSATPTPTTAAKAWSASSEQTPSSPFTPFTPGPYYQCRQLQPPPQQQPVKVPPAYRAFRPSRLRSASEAENRSLPAVSVHSTMSREEGEDNSSTRSLRSAKSAAAATSSSGGPRTPQEFMAWRRELVESRNASTSGEPPLSRSYALGEPPPAVAGNTGRGPLECGEVVRSPRRQASSEAHGLSLYSPTTTTAAAAGATAAAAASTGAMGVHVRNFAGHGVPHEDVMLPRAVTPMSTEVHRRRQRFSGSPHSRPADARPLFAQSASAPLHRIPYPHVHKPTSSDDFPQLSGQSTPSRFSSHAGSSASGLRRRSSSNFVGRDVEDQGKRLVVARLPPPNQERWGVREDIMMALVLIAALLYISNHFFFIDVASFFPW